MKIALVTGSNEFLGRYVVQELLNDKEWDVHSTDINSFYNKCDLTDKNQIIEMFGSIYDDLKPPIDVIFHVASLFDYSADYHTLYNVNVDGTKNLIEVAHKFHVKKIVLVSSLAVYGIIDKWYNYPIQEYELLNPKIKGNYDISKRDQENLAKTICKSYGIDLVIVRPAPLYGPNSKYGFYNLMKMIKLGALPAAPINLHDKKFPLVHVKDVARTMKFLAEQEHFDVSEKVFNLCDDNCLDMYDTFRFIARETGGNFTRLIPINLKLLKPMFLLINKLCEWIGKRKKQRSKFETDTMNYMFGNYWFSNRKIKSTGFEFLYSDRKIGLLKTIESYDRRGWN